MGVGFTCKQMCLWSVLPIGHICKLKIYWAGFTPQLDRDDMIGYISSIGEVFLSTCTTQSFATIKEFNNSIMTKVKDDLLYLSSTYFIDRN
jgi:hypothetical protein